MDLYEITIPVFIRNLLIAGALIGKAEKFAKKNDMLPVEILEAKLAPDMYNLTQQIQYAYFMALEAGEKLSGKKPHEFAYDETTFAELKKSLARAIVYLETIKPRDFSGAERIKVETFLLPGKKITAKKYVLEFAIPNFFFHTVTAYDILRHLGVPLRKEDYLGSR